MEYKKNILIDFLETIVESKPREIFWGLVLKNLQKNQINKKDFFGYWKEHWFKSNITKKYFVQELNKKFEFGEEVIVYLRNILDYKNLTLIGKRLNFLSKLNNLGYRIHLVSDCGVDTKEFVENSELNNILSKRFYSFNYGTTKDEMLYDFVIRELGVNCLMIGDNYRRDYEIPKKYGLKAVYVKKTDNLEGLLWKD